MVGLAQVWSASKTAARRASKVRHAFAISLIAISATTAINLVLMRALNIFPWEPRFILATAGGTVGSTLTVVGQTLQLLYNNVRDNEAQVSPTQIV